MTPDVVDRSVLVHRRAAPGAGIIFTSDGRKMAAADQNGDLRIWDMTAADVPRSARGAAWPQGSCPAIRLRPRRKAPGQFRRRRRCSAVGPLRRPTGQATSCCRADIISRFGSWHLPPMANGWRHATPRGSSAFGIWQCPARPAARSRWQGHQASVQQMAFTADGRELVSADERGEVRLWRLATADLSRSKVLLPSALRANSPARIASARAATAGM